MMPPSMATVEAQAACWWRSRLELMGNLFRQALFWLCAAVVSSAKWFAPSTIGSHEEAQSVLSVKLTILL